MEITGAEAALIEAVSEPLFLLSGDRTIIWRNAASREKEFIESTGIGDERFAFRDSAFERRVAGLLTSVAEAGGQARTTAPCDRRMWQVVAIQRRTMALMSNGEISPRDRILVIMSEDREPEAPQQPGPTTSLSPVEKTLVSQLAAGRTVREASQQMRVSYHTARKYLQNIYAKTGARRQAELVAMLGAGAPRP